MNSNEALIKNNITPQILTKIIKAYNSLNISFGIIELNQNNLYQSCLSFEENTNQLYRALSECWSFIDNLHRIREVCRQAPTLNQKGLEFRKFLEVTEIAEECRHYMQHLARENNNENDTTPSFGSLSWLDKDNNSKVHLRVIGIAFKGSRHSMIPFDRLEGKFISRVSLSVMDRSFNFDLIYPEIINFKNFILAKLRTELANNGVVENE